MVVPIGQKVPSKQSGHVVCPVAFWYVEMGQKVHSKLPVVSVYEPTLHSMGAVELSGQ
jgi:hypothetical protein